MNHHFMAATDALLPPRVTIVTPSYNQAPFLEETILSVLDQDYSNLEYIIIDGGSSDGSVEIIKKYADRLAHWVSEPDQGQSHALNKGFARATGDILAWLNSDDTYEPDALWPVVQMAARHPEAELFHGDCAFIDEHNQKMGFLSSSGFQAGKLLSPSWGYPYPRNLPQPAVFFRRSLWECAGPLDLGLHYAMDYDLWIRMSRCGAFHYVPRTLANYRLSKGTKTVSQMIPMVADVLGVTARHGGLTHGGWALASYFMDITGAGLSPLRAFTYLHQVTQTWPEQTRSFFDPGRAASYAYLGRAFQLAREGRSRELTLRYVTLALARNPTLALQLPDAIPFLSSWLKMKLGDPGAIDLSALRQGQRP